MIFNVARSRSCCLSIAVLPSGLSKAAPTYSWSRSAAVRRPAGGMRWRRTAVAEVSRPGCQIGIGGSLVRGGKGSLRPLRLGDLSRDAVAFQCRSGGRVLTVHCGTLCNRRISSSYQWRTGAAWEDTCQRRRRANSGKPGGLKRRSSAGSYAAVRRRVGPAIASQQRQGPELEIRSCRRQPPGSANRDDTSLRRCSAARYAPLHPACPD